MGKIVSIHSFRGGTGKSNTTSNLAAQVAMAGKRVGVVDTDIQSPGIHVIFGLNAEKMGKTLNDFLNGKCSIEEVAFSVGENTGDAKGRQKLAGKHLYLFPSSITVDGISQIVRESYDPNVLNEGLQKVIKSLDLDYLFIDTHPGINEETLLSLTISDVLIIILRPDQQDFQGTAITVDVAQLLDVPHMFLVVNKALSRYDFKQVKEEVESAYGVPVAGVLPLSEDIVDLASSDLFSLYDPDHPWSKGVREVANAILGLE